MDCRETTIPLQRILKEGDAGVDRSEEEEGTFMMCSEPYVRLLITAYSINVRSEADF